MKIEFNTVYFEVKEEIGHIVINDPPANKMTALFLIEFTDLVRKHVVLSGVKGIIISGKGRHYSSGADVEQLKEIFGTQSKFDNDGKVIAPPMSYLENRNTFNYFHNTNIPVISAINGLCMGSGFELALCSHIRVCGSGSILGLPESTFGFLPGVNGTLRCTELIGLGKAMELILSGDTFAADEALEFGLIDVIVNKKETLSYCEELMKFILQKDKVYSKSYVQEYLKNFKKVYKNVEGSV